MIDNDVEDAFSAEREAANEAALRERNNLREAYWTTFMTTPQGKLVLNHLLEYTGQLSSTHTGDPKDCFNEGARVVGLLILENLGLDSIRKLIQLLGAQTHE